MNTFPHRGTDFVRGAITFAIAMKRGIGPADMAELAASQWGQRSPAVAVTKAAVSSGGTGSGDWGAELAAEAAIEFFEEVRPLTITGKLQGLRRVPARVPVVSATTGATANWRGQHKAIKVSKSAMASNSMTPLTLSAIHVLSVELLEAAAVNLDAFALVRAALIRACVQAKDLAFIDPSNAGSAGATPAAVSNAAPTITGTGDPADDLEAAIGSFAGDLTTASWIMHPRTAVQIALRSGGQGIGAGVGARGGELVGLPCVTSESVPHDSDSGKIVLLDAGSVAFFEAAPTFSVLTEGLIEMNDAPAGAGDTPTAASATLMSLWQTELVAMCVNHRTNWRLARTGGCVVVTAASYPGV